MIGPEALLSQAMHLGGDGGVNGGANVFPELFVACYNACRDGNVQRVVELNAIIQDWQRVYNIGKYASRQIKSTKCSLSLLGICDDFMADPFHRFRQPERDRVQQILQSIDLSPLT